MFQKNNAFVKLNLIKMLKIPFFKKKIPAKN